MIGLATRDITDRIIQPFVVKENGTFHKKTSQVARNERTHWKTFDRDEWLKKKIPVTIFGCLRGTEYIIQDCKINNITYYYFDHAYIHKAIKHKINSVTGTKHYRITKNGESINKLIDWKNDKVLEARVKSIRKLEDLKIDIDFYKRHNGKDIIILPPTDFICKLYNYGSSSDWIEKTMNEIKKHTDRNIIIKRKEDKQVSLELLFKQAYCVVSSQTTAVIDSLKKGIPSFCEDISCAKPVSKTDLSQIERPHYPTNEEIEDWIGTLISCQYSIEEIHSGEARTIIDRIQ